MIVPLIITATGLFFFYSAIGLAHTYAGIILAHAMLGIPFVIILLTTIEFLRRRSERLWGVTPGRRPWAEHRPK